MSLSSRDQLRYWGIGLLVLLVVLWAIGQALVPFLVGAAIAYFLDPVADRLERLGLSRAAATVVITLAALLIAAGALLVLIPSVVRQVTALVQTTPEMVRQFQAFLSEHYPQVLTEDSPLRSALSSASDTLQQKGLTMLNSVLSSSLALIDFLMLIVVAPVVAFYLLLDWDRMIAVIDTWLPRQHAPVIRDLALKVDRVLAGFVRGQLLVCVILGSFYAIALALLGLQFGLVIGLVAGLISFIPFVGSIVGGALSIGLALFQFWGEWPWIAAVAGVFIVGQAIEGNVLTPRLVGGSVGLHPVWLMFALSAFGALMGFSGLLIAVPVAAAIGVLGRFAMAEYQSGRLYRGTQDGPDA
ncbi:AI-2E family transporter [Paroceanicella profunda]|uniref:AI-2E family transporter n=1 Tax=Paroceanicella profunda TaxID=2579971 RepID=A0A5B8FX91_9RHOB|nr:AI-2E family transporter [Paroceanicella profunda]QDL92214.1 AI-2E family transporter [Paroceanicella profunda]